MIKLFKLTNKINGTYWCFAPDVKTAIKIVIKNAFSGKRKILHVSDVTSEHIDEDGVRDLINNNFIGIPKKKVFMLNGSVSAMAEHFDVKKRSEVLWYSEKIPGSKELWQ